MTRFRTALVPIDFSDRSQPALRAASELVGSGGAVHAVHILGRIEANEPGVIWGTVDDDSRTRHAAEAVEKLVAEAGVPGVTVHVRIQPGNPAHGIVAMSEELGADLVVVPAAGKTGLAALGSVAERVVRLSRRPVLVLHEG
ncbi:MAG: universal stress protein [Deltaproteobacteria bacterium]|nr:MAG: universal stress protein [Deltaproteobacteria bacterium]